jgi:hypothetical protein
MELCEEREGKEGRKEDREEINDEDLKGRKGGRKGGRKKEDACCLPIAVESIQALSKLLNRHNISLSLVLPMRIKRPRVT